MNNFRKEKINNTVFNKRNNYILFFLIIICVFGYAYIANTTVRNLALLQKNFQTKQLLDIRVSDLESKTMLIDDSFNKTLAYNLGFIEIKGEKFIVTPKSDKLSFKTD